ncbi:hypothetical protein ANCCAN_00385 [Ancylostoma caninum]|uniref:Uncharacterized protein n=1 Tax=Ancylostoma caninum TaxID=29170 RepID=A0A368H9N4_ANCCA|nr:hypothetical protein ANCCAN_00385 [Ancylostoma caninum]
MICSGSQKADIYHLSPQGLPFPVWKILSELVTTICHGNKGNPFYPSLPNDNDYTLRLTSIMQQCWSTKLDTRPALYAISDAVAREFEKE